ncbi:MAG: tRNA epoxyqueuosine(34) reductase QueG [Ilumatobacteraceae bacterium]
MRLVKKPELSSELAGPYSVAALEVGRRAGLHRVGIAPAIKMDRAHDALVSRNRDGLSDTMQFTFRNPERSTNPAASLTDARSLVVGAFSYASPATPVSEPQGARVARYAWSDYYEQLRHGLQAVADFLRGDGWRAIVFADDNSLVDRESAYLAGLGWYGKNANLMISGAGSNFVLGSVITDAPLVGNERLANDGCGECRRCLDSCPTSAIVEPGVVDARKCLAWLLQKPGVFDRNYRQALGDRIYGCDDCQESCPPTIRFRSRQEISADIQPWISVLFLLTSDDDALLSVVGSWYIANRNPDWVRRNALVVLGNIGDPRNSQICDVVKHYLEHPDPMLRAHAVWAAARLNLRHLIPYHDTAPLVIDELSHLPEPRVRV